MKTTILALFIVFSLFLAGCAVNQAPEPSRFVCPDGREVSDLSKCPQAPAPEQNETPEPEQPTTPPANPPQQPPAEVKECGNGVCAASEDFGSCADDCPADYRYLYQYVDGLNYEYKRCDRIGDRVSCWTEFNYIETAKIQKDPKTGQVYNVYNSYQLRTVNGTGTYAATFNTWINKSTSECLYSYDKAPPVNVFYNDSPVIDKIYTCPDITGVEYVSTESVDVPAGQFDKAQKFMVSYVRNPDKVPKKLDYITVWKVAGPLPSWKPYPFIVQGNVLIPVKAEWEWTYIDNAGIERHVVSNATLSAYSEPVDFGLDQTNIGQGVG